MSASALGLLVWNVFILNSNLEKTLLVLLERGGVVFDPVSILDQIILESQVLSISTMVTDFLG